MEQISNPVNRLHITAYPRMHITLIGMGTGGYRINGGIGFAVEQPSVKFEIKIGKAFSLLDERAIPLSNSGAHRLSVAIRQASERFEFKESVQVKIISSVRSHFGFGAGTMIRLACLEALFLINGQNYSPQVLQELSGRGQTSGVGLNTYFNGGLIFDLGHIGGYGKLQPSNSKEFGDTLPLLLKRSKMPLWNIGICIPKDIQPLGESEEKAFFAKICPIASKEVYETLYHATYGLQSAVLENDKDTFCKALIAIQRCSWKAAERHLYGSDLLNIENALYKCGASAVGMSSLGPSLFFVANDVKQVADGIEKIGLNCDIVDTVPSNRGRIINYD